MNALRSSASCQVAPATASSISFSRHTCEAGLYQYKSRIKQSGSAQGSNNIVLSAPPQTPGRQQSWKGPDGGIGSPTAGRNPPWPPWCCRYSRSHRAVAGPGPAAAYGGLVVVAMAASGRAAPRRLPWHPAGSAPRFRRRGGCWERGSMETHELFRRLGAGARFDVRRFGLDARRFGVRGQRGESSGIGPGAVQAPELRPSPIRGAEERGLAMASHPFPSSPAGA